MPRGNRKRGKKHRKLSEEDQLQSNQKTDAEKTARPSWISRPTEVANNEAPFGLVDSDVKAYFRTVDVQIRDWQESQGHAENESDDVDPNEGTYHSRVTHGPN